MEQMENVLFVRSSKKNAIVGSPVNEDDVWDDSALVEAYDQAMNAAKIEVMKRMGLLDMESSTSCSVQTAPPVSKKRSHQKKWNKGKNVSKQHKWSVGDACRCVYAEDGLSYEACIIQTNPTGTCIVKYVGYDNEEEVDMKSLQFSHGHAARLRQAEEARAGMECGVSGNNGDEIDQESTSSHSDYKPKSKHDNYKEQASSSHSRLNEKTRPTMKCDVNQSHFPQHSPMNSLPMMFPPPPPPHVLTSHEFISNSEALSNMLMSWYMSGFHTGFYQGIMQGTQNRVSKCNCCHNKH